jgi:GWxTD domain-containing protein
LSRPGNNRARAVLSVDADEGRKILFVRIGKRKLACSSLFLLGAGLFAPLSAETLGELFGRVKSKVAAGAYAEGLAALGELEAEARKPENEKALAPLRPAAAFYRGVCLAALGKPNEAKAEFAVFIAANPDRGIDRKAYPASVVAAFEEARKSRPGASQAEDKLSPLMLAYRSTNPPSESAAPPGPDWASGPVKYFLAEGEKREYSRLSDDYSRGRFVSFFWRARDPTPETQDNEFRREFERRVAFADEQFTEGSTRGSLTDRGMVFVLLGPPTGVARRPISAAEDTPAVLPMTSARMGAPRPTVGPTEADQLSNWKEVWRYASDVLPPGMPDRHVDFSFVTRADYGKKLLQRDGPSIRTLEAAKPKPRPVD